MVTETSRLNAARLRSHLLRCGYRSAAIESDVQLPDSRPAALAAFAHTPHDARSSCIAAVNGFTDPFSDAAACRPLGAPVIFVCFPSHLEWWVQGSTKTERRDTVPVEHLDNFFAAHRAEFAPEAIYRAKTLARFEKQYQLDFVDAGLVPLVESAAGEKLVEIVHQTVLGTKKRLGWTEISVEDGHWLLQANFWLLPAKILKDKAVPAFSELNLEDLKEVYARLAEHYGAPEPVRVDSKAKTEALRQSAREIAQRSHLGLVSTEALAHLYENALITKETRADLGTHSTPPFLVDYILGKLRPWLQAIPWKDHNVFEPACGHAGFLLAAMRVLNELLPTEMSAPSARRGFLRSRLHGCDKDPFALEIARLSLTLADVPNPNGWDLQPADMFAGDLLAEKSRAATLVLANPPFEDFTAEKRKAASSQHVNQATEMLWRVVGHLRPGSVFGVVLPQTLLHSREATPLREYLARNFELGEICLFPDDVFTFSDAESAIVMGRRLRAGERPSGTVAYQRVREADVEEFKRDYRVTTSRVVNASHFTSTSDRSFLIPDLQEIWEYCGRYPSLSTIAEVGQGLTLRSRTDARCPKGELISVTRQAGFTKAFIGLKTDPRTDERPASRWINLSADAILYPRHGLPSNMPQLLLNYAPVSRGPWRLKAFIDAKGHAVTSRFLVIRPTDRRWSLEALWAICNSPFGNAYSYAFSGKRDILAGLIREMPLPPVEPAQLAPLTKTVQTYFRTVRKAHDEHVSDSLLERLRVLHLRIDAEVLRLYALPRELERQVLGLFSGCRRLGVPFRQEGYFPKDFTEPLTLAELLAITVDWEQTNARRGRLILKEEDKTLRPTERDELSRLQDLTDARIRLVAPLPLTELAAIAADLKHKGHWIESGL